jgi:transcriptional regulator with XRE-family HTH domain
VSVTTDESRLFPALLKHWRGCRGLSQLDLALSADVSSRHVSFLETGRAKPSREMVLRLGTTLDVPLREQNEMLRAAGFQPEFSEPSLHDGLPPAIAGAIERMMAKHEPYPMVVLDHHYDVVRSNHAAMRFIAALVPEPSRIEPPINVFHMLFDPSLGRSAVADWETTARAMVSRLHREALARPGDAALHALVESLFAYPAVPEHWRHPDFGQPSEPVLALRVRVAGELLSFLTTVTIFDAPQNITMQELRIESYFPLDDTTRAACERLST